MAISGTSGSNQPQSKGFVRNLLGKATEAINHNPARRNFLKTIAAGATGGGVLTLAGEKTFGWLFSEDLVISNLKQEIIPLLKIGSKEEAQKLINDAISIHSESGDYERVGRIALLAKEIDGEQVANPQLDVPNADQMQEFRAQRIQALTQNMDSQELDKLISSLVTKQPKYSSGSSVIFKKLLTCSIAD